MTSAIQVGELPALIQEWLRQVRHQLFPQRLRLQIDDQGLSVQVLTRGKAPMPPPVEVPLPVGICRQGIPQNGAALGDFIGDWLLELGLVACQVEAVLPGAVCQWRVVTWPFDDHPDDPLQALRQLQIDLGDPCGSSSRTWAGSPCRRALGPRRAPCWRRPPSPWCRPGRRCSRWRG